MKILTRYVLREHIAPFIAALAVLTGLMLLNTLAKRFGDLVGKGLPWHVIAEVFGLSIPFILAMTLPMAVLVAVLYAFSRLGVDNEITAMRASGVSLVRLMVPVLLTATVLAVGMLWFNDRVLPNANHHLRQLLTDIGHKRPTFELRERAVNEVVPNKLFLQAAKIDRARSVLRDLTIFDLGRPGAERTIYADSGYMAFNPDLTDLFLTLYDGSMHELETANPSKDSRTYYRKQVIRVPDVSNQLERGQGGDWRGDREMDIAMMEAEIATRHENLRQLRDSVTLLMGPMTPPISEASPKDTIPGQAEKRLIELPGVKREVALEGRRGLPGRVQAVEKSESAAVPAPTRRRPEAGTAESKAGAAGRSTPMLNPRLFRNRTLRWPPGTEPAVFAARVRGALQALASRQEIQRRDINRYAVEIHKKFSIPVAAIVFVLLGAPIGVRFPRGGIGMVIGVSLAVFCVYYVCLIGGEELADRTLITPFWAMWAPNVIFTILGAGALLWLTREGARWWPKRLGREGSEPPPPRAPSRRPAEAASEVGA